jgi:hypothetical protein
MTSRFSFPIRKLSTLNAKDVVADSIQPEVGLYLSPN